MSRSGRLTRFIEEMNSEPGDYEELGPGGWLPLEVWLPKTRSPRRTLYVTKGAAFRHWTWTDALPDDSAILCRYGLPTATYRREISAYFSRAPQAIFVGDLDPLDLHLYLTLREDTATLRYGGLNDACLDLCERNLKRGQRLEAPMFTMGPMEQRHFSILDSMVDVAALIGPRSRDLLRSGRKLELEGATNMSYFKQGHHEALRSLIERTKPTAAPAPARRA